MMRAGPAVRVTLLPDGVTVSGHAGDTLLDAALDNGVEMEHECGGNCTCTSCQVVVEAGMEHLSPMEPHEDERLDTADNREPRSRLGCQALLTGGGDVVARLMPGT